MLKVGFFGGSGFLGSAFDDHMQTNQTDIQLTVLSRAMRSGIRSQFLTVDASLEESFNKFPPYEVVIHGVADSQNGPRLPAHEKIEKQLRCTLNIAKYCARKNVRRLIFLSSGAVYGNRKSKSENVTDFSLDVTSRQSAYALAKLTCEQFLQSFCGQHSIELCILRCFTFAGPKIPKKSHYAYSNFIQAALSRNDIVIRGDGKDSRSYLHHKDFSRILMEVINRNDIPKIMNVGSEKAVTIQQLAEKIAELSGNCRVKILNEIPSINHYYVPKVTELKSFLPEYTPITLDEIIKDSLKAHA